MNASNHNVEKKIFPLPMATLIAQCHPYTCESRLCLNWSLQVSWMALRIRAKPDES